MSVAPRFFTTHRRVALLTAGALLPVPLLAGCGSHDDQSDPTAAVTDVGRAARVQLRDSGTVRWAIDAAPRTFNAFQDDADEGTDRVAGAVLPALFTLDDRGRPQRDPDYLRSVAVARHGRRQVVTYTLNPKAVWSDGRPVGATDFVAQWRALRGRNPAYQAAHNDGYDRISSVTPERGGRRVEVTFAKPYADWRALFTPLYPRNVMADPDAFQEQARAGLATTAGPFRMRAAGPRAVTLVRNRRWWGDRARLTRLVFTVVPRDQRYRALADGRVDLAEVDQNTADRLTRDGGPTGLARDGAASGLAGAPGHRGAGWSTSASAGGGSGTAPGGTGAGTAGDGAGRTAASGRSTASQSAGARAAGHGGAPKSGRKAQVGARFTVRKALEPAYTQLAMNGARGPLADQRVRRAVARALDRRALARAELGPLGLPDRPLGNHLLMAGQPGYHDDSDAIGGASRSAAQTLLADAGWRLTDGTADGGGAAGVRAGGRGADGHAAHGGHPDSGNGDGHRSAGPGRTGGPSHARSSDAPHAGHGAAAGAPVLIRHGKPLTLRFVLPGGRESAPLRRTGRRIAGMLDAVGIRTEISTVAADGYFADHIAPGDFDLALYAWPATAFPATDARPVYAKPQAAADGSLIVDQNFTRVGTDRIDQLLDQASTELDPGTARGLMRQADARIWAAAGSVPLFQRPELVATRRGLANAGAFGFATPRYQDVGYLR